MFPLFAIPIPLITCLSLPPLPAAAPGNYPLSTLSTNNLAELRPIFEEIKIDLQHVFQQNRLVIPSRELVNDHKRSQYIRIDD